VLSTPSVRHCECVIPVLGPWPVAIAFSTTLHYAVHMKELIEILLGMAVVAGLGWLYLYSLVFYERIFGRRLESPWMSWLRRRNRPVTIFGKNDEDVL
jgi:hypothetical protein